jgi:hypothetical protein
MSPALRVVSALLDRSLFLLERREAQMKRRAIATVALTAALLVDMSPAEAQRRTQVGRLRCTLDPSVGLVVGSRQRMSCEFVADRRAFRDLYSGTMTRVGLDLGITGGGVLRWAVFARTKGLRRGALAGTYVGASGDITLGVGVGANALVGGSGRSIMLQPLSVSGQVGVNLALGVARLTLRPR